MIKKLCSKCFYATNINPCPYCIKIAKGDKRLIPKK